MKKIFVVALLYSFEKSLGLITDSARTGVVRIESGSPRYFLPVFTSLEEARAWSGGRGQILEMEVVDDANSKAN